MASDSYHMSNITLFGRSNHFSSTTDHLRTWRDPFFERLNLLYVLLL
jgi:hypothetical protein